MTQILFKCQVCQSNELILDAVPGKDGLEYPINVVCRSCLHYEQLIDKNGDYVHD
jgi:hypothetical protein